MERLSVISLLGLTLAAASVHAEETSLSTTQDLRLVPVAEDLEQPWGVAVLPGGLFVISERTGQIQTFYNGERQEVEGLPGIHVEGQAGLLDVAASPDYPDTGWIYFTYASGDTDSTATALARGRLAGDQLVDVEELFEQNRRSEPGPRAGSRLAWLEDDTLLMSVGDRGDPERAQDTQDHAGSILRLDPQGLAPEDNPLLEEAGFLPRIYSWGHRHVLGLAVDEKRGYVWAVEARSNGHDEVLLIQPGKNHGAAAEGEDTELLELGASSGFFNEEEVVEPAYRFSENVSPSGLAVINGDHYPEWEGNLLVGGLESEQLHRLVIRGNEVTEEEALLDETFGPVRDVRQGPDGYIYMLVGDESGTLYRLEPEA
ncbi:PQQ-dependent sugar dehydrogenase [Billgrantia bachuensis]|uniref:PQQ-dependent sugar dehydrogenase n=1 Tax=Billgrantia bachuensis TaxID=2717286 RepID=A0ABX0Q1N6_9GAMM|nr:PQQ-dependent sugar dehydrogenase [Halomonas bachuensis]NIC07974.1 PQQ-dependent sugar dehydrogenase [Halomonas bachuensis]